MLALDSLALDLLLEDHYQHTINNRTLPQTDTNPNANTKKQGIITDNDGSNSGSGNGSGSGVAGVLKKGNFLSKIINAFQDYGDDNFARTLIAEEEDLAIAAEGEGGKVENESEDWAHCKRRRGRRRRRRVRVYHRRVLRDHTYRGREVLSDTDSSSYSDEGIDEDGVKYDDGDDTSSYGNTSSSSESSESSQSSASSSNSSSPSSNNAGICKKRESMIRTLTGKEQASLVRRQILNGVGIQDDIDSNNMDDTDITNDIMREKKEGRKNRRRDKEVYHENLRKDDKKKKNLINKKKNKKETLEDRVKKTKEKVDLVMDRVLEADGLHHQRHQQELKDEKEKEKRHFHKHRTTLHNGIKVGSPETPSSFKNPGMLTEDGYPIELDAGAGAGPIKYDETIPFFVDRPPSPIVFARTLCKLKIASDLPLGFMNSIQNAYTVHNSKESGRTRRGSSFGSEADLDVGVGRGRTRTSSFQSSMDPLEENTNYPKSGRKESVVLLVSPREGNESENEFDEGTDYEGDVDDDDDNVETQNRQPLHSPSLTTVQKPIPYSPLPKKKLYSPLMKSHLKRTSSFLSQQQQQPSSTSPPSTIPTPNQHHPSHPSSNNAHNLRRNNKPHFYGTLNHTHVPNVLLSPDMSLLDDLRGGDDLWGGYDAVFKEGEKNGKGVGGESEKKVDVESWEHREGRFYSPRGLNDGGQIKKVKVQRSRTKREENRRKKEELVTMDLQNTLSLQSSATTTADMRSEKSWTKEIDILKSKTRKLTLETIPRTFIGKMFRNWCESDDKYVQTDETGLPLIALFGDESSLSLKGGGRVPHFLGATVVGSEKVTGWGRSRSRRRGEGAEVRFGL